MGAITYYKRVAFDNVDDGGDVTVYTTEYERSRITIEFTDIDINSPGEAVFAYVDDYSSVDTGGVMLAEVYFQDEGNFVGSDPKTYSRIKYYSAILPSGIAIRVNADNESNVDGFVHVERMAASAE